MVWDGMVVSTYLTLVVNRLFTIYSSYISVVLTISMISMVILWKDKHMGNPTEITQIYVE